MAPASQPATKQSPERPEAFLELYCREGNTGEAAWGQQSDMGTSGHPAVCPTQVIPETVPSWHCSDQAEAMLRPKSFFFFSSGFSRQVSL